MKKILVLDVDETLLNLEPLSFLNIFKKNYREHKGELMLDKYYLSLRPGLKEFIKKARERFKLVAFSAADKKITKEKLKRAGILNNFFRIYGEEDLENKKKSLRKIARDLNVKLSDITAVDDQPEHYLETEGVLKITPWFLGQEDNELLKVLKQLKLNISA